MLQLLLIVAVSLYVDIYKWKWLHFAPISFFFWSWMQKCRAGWELGLKGGQCCSFVVVVVLHTQLARRGGGTDKASAWQWLLQLWSRDLSITKCSLGIVSFSWHLHKREITGAPVCWWRNSMTCLVSDGLGDSQHCVEQKSVGRANVLTAVHGFLLKHRCDTRMSWAVIFQVSFCVLPSLRDLIFNSWGNAFPWVLAWSNEDIRWLVVLMAGECFSQEASLGLYIAKGAALDLVKVSCCSHPPSLEAHTSHVQCCILHHGDWVTKLPLSPSFLYSWIYSYRKGGGEEVSRLLYF